MSEYGYVYAILDPRKPFEDGIIGSMFYIGITTKTIKERLNGHVSESKRYIGKNIHKERKIRKILKSGFDLYSVPIHKTKINNLSSLERFYIKYFRTLGAKLTNESPGGDFNPLIDLPPERIEEVKEKIKVTKKILFQKKIEEKCKDLGIEVEQYTVWRLEQYRLYHKQRRLNMSVEDREKYAKYSRERNDKFRETLGDDAFKELVAKERREWFNNLSEERKEEQRKKESVYCKTRRANETLEQKLERREKVTSKRHQAKQKLIEEIGIEAFRLLEKDRRKNWSPRKKKSKSYREERNRIHREYMANETPEQRESRLQKTRGKRPSRSKEAVLKRQQLKLQQSPNSHH